MAKWSALQAVRSVMMTANASTIKRMIPITTIRLAPMGV
jgi:hypothetical protein